MRRGVAISGREMGIVVVVIATWSSFCAGVGEFFRCFRVCFVGLLERLRDSRFAESGISSVG